MKVGHSGNRSLSEPFTESGALSVDAKQGQEIVVDVREQLRAGKEPFSQIMAAAETCEVGDALVLYATFKPVPLLMLLKAQGFKGEATKLGKGDWRVDFLRVSRPKVSPNVSGIPEAAGPSPKGSAGATDAEETVGETKSAAAGGHPDVHLDNRGLEPPEPMVRTLEAVYNLKEGQRIVGKFDRTPMFLLPKLDDMGYSYEVEPEEDGRATVTIWRDPKTQK